MHSPPERIAVAVVCHIRLVTTIASRWTATARIGSAAGLRHAEQLRRVAEGLDLLGRLLLAGLELLAVSVHPDYRDLQLEAGVGVRCVAGGDVHPARLAADSTLALLEVRGVGLVGAHLLSGDDEVEVDAEVPPRRAEQLVVDVREDAYLELLGEAFELSVRLAERHPARHARGEEARPRRLELPTELLGRSHGGAPQHFGVELVRAALDLPLDVEEQRHELVPIDREPVPIRLLLERFVRPALPVDERAVAVEGDEANILG